MAQPIEAGQILIDQWGVPGVFIVFLAFVVWSLWRANQELHRDIRGTLDTTSAKYETLLTKTITREAEVLNTLDKVLDALSVQRYLKDISELQKRQQND